MNKFNLRLFTSIVAILIIGLAAGYLTAERFNLKPGETENVDVNILSKEAVSEKVTNFIKEMVGTPDKEIEIEVLEITDADNGLYRLKLAVDNQDFVSYVTKDGELLFPQYVDMNPPESQQIPLAEKPIVDLFVMSFCPYGNQAEDLMKPIVDLVGPAVDFNLHYIIYSGYQTEDYCLSAEQKYCSMHKTAEVNQNIRELCVAEYQPDKSWDFVTEINKRTTAEKVEEDWEAIATELGIDVGKIKECQEKEGTTLLDQEIILTEQEYPVQDPTKHQQNGEYKTAIGIQGSPALVINGMIYDGERSTEGYQEAICDAFKNTPSVCSQTIENSEVNEEQPAGTCQ